MISTKTGEVMLSTVAHKTIISAAIRGSAFKFVALDKILEAEAGFTHQRARADRGAAGDREGRPRHDRRRLGAQCLGLCRQGLSEQEISKLDAEQALAPRVNEKGAAAPVAVATRRRQNGAPWKPAVQRRRQRRPPSRHGQQAKARRAKLAAKVAQ